MIILFLGLVFAQPQCTMIVEPLRMCVEAVGKLMCTSDLASRLDTSLVNEFTAVSGLAVSVLGAKAQTCFELWRRARCKELFVGPGVCASLCRDLSASGCLQSLFPVAGCANQQTQAACSDIFSGQCALHAGETIQPTPRPTTTTPTQPILKPAQPTPRPTPRAVGGGGGGGGGVISGAKSGGRKLVKLLLVLAVLRMF